MLRAGVSKLMPELRTRGIATVSGSLHDLSFYRATANRQTKFPSLEQSIDVETCIVGGGYAGLNSALALLERGQKDVVLLENETIAHGASGRNGGFVFGGYSLGESSLVKQLGPERAKTIYTLTLDAVDLIRNRIKKYNIDCDAQYGGIYLANWFKDDEILRDAKEFMEKSMGVDWEYVSAEELSKKLITKRYHGALYERNAFHFHPLNYALGLADTVSSLGGKVFTQTPVVRIEQTTGGDFRHIIHTKNGSTVRAKNVVLCCGGYIAGLHKPLASAVLPIATYVMATEPLGDRAKTAINTDAAVYDTRFAFDYYRMLRDTRLLWGGRISILDRNPEDVKRLLYKDLMRVYPQLANVNIDFAWSGLMSYAQHKMPQIGQLPTGEYYAMGFGGHGVGPTTVAGEIIAKTLIQGPQVLGDFTKYGLPKTFGYAGMLAAQATYWYFEFRDWMRDRD